MQILLKSDNMNGKFARVIDLQTIMTGPNRITLARINRETEDLAKNPIDKILVARHSIFDFHFCFYGMDPPYEGGYYHGLLRLDPDYPHKAPSIEFFTPSGRFVIGQTICTTFSSYHQESWSCTWTVRTLLIGLLSFWYSQESTYGSASESESKKRSLASKSLKDNFKRPLFKELFSEALEKMGVTEPQQSLQQPIEVQNNQNIDIENEEQEEEQGSDDSSIEQQRAVSQRSYTSSSCSDSSVIEAQPQMNQNDPVEGIVMAERLIEQEIDILKLETLNIQDQMRRGVYRPNKIRRINKLILWLPNIFPIAVVVGCVIRSYRSI